MELGNMLMGNSRGKFEMDDRSLVESAEWEDLCDVISFDGYSLGKKVEADNHGGIKCKLFELHPYYWGDCDCGVGDDSDKPHKGHCSLVRHNFVYKPEGIEIDWYKYPFRDSYTNREISTDKLREIFHKCAEAYRNTMLISLDSLKPLNYTPMRGASIGTKTLKNGRQCIRLVREFDKGKRTEALGIKAECEGIDGYVFDIDSVCSYKSVKGSNMKLIVPKDGVFTLSGKEVQIVNPKEIHRAWYKICFVELKEA